jgi:hypothetical protein
MRELKVGKMRYLVAGSDAEIALAHVLGLTFIELQQLEFSIVSHLSELSDDVSMTYEASFDVFASKTFGNLIREMHRHDFMKSFAADMATMKEKRDFFVHKFLFHRFGGEFTTDSEYEDLIKDAANIGNLFADTRTKFTDFMLQNAPLLMIAAKRDSKTGELIFVESEYSKKKPRASSDEE